MANIKVIFSGIIFLLLIVLGAYAVELTMSTGNVIMYAISNALHIKVTDYAPLTYFYYAFYVVIAGIIVVLILKLVNALRSQE